MTRADDSPPRNEGTERRRPGRVSFLLLAGSMLPLCIRGQSLEYPAADREDLVEDHHGTRVPDPYRWMERLDDARTLEWVKAERALTARYVAAIPERSAIRRRLVALSNDSRTEVPWREGGRIFYLRRSGLHPQPVLYMQPSLGAKPRIVLDANRISPDGSVAVREYAASPDGRFLAYNSARGGSDFAETRVRALSSRRDLEDVVDPEDRRAAQGAHHGRRDRPLEPLLGFGVEDPADERLA